MPKRLIDYEAFIWSSFKLSQCKPSSRVEYVWIYEEVDAGGPFEMTIIRSLWGKISLIRPDLSLKKLKMCLEQYERHGLLFTWDSSGKTSFGHCVGPICPVDCQRPVRSLGSISFCLSYPCKNWSSPFLESSQGKGLTYVKAEA